MKADVIAQLEKCGFTDYVTHYVPSPVGPEAVAGRVRIKAVMALEADERFAQGTLYQLHRDVGHNLTEFRSFRGSLGPGSLQIVIDKKTGAFHADIDRFNPYADLVNWFGHAFGEVVPNAVKGLARRVFRRKK